MKGDKYLVVKCPYCKQMHVVPTSVKTTQCCRCNKKLNPQLAKIASFKNGKDARDFIASLAKGSDIVRASDIAGDIPDDIA